MTTASDEEFRKAAENQMKIWAEALELMADKTCNDPACPDRLCNQKQKESE